MRRLNADEIECRVAQVSAKGCSLLLYKTARTDATILTEIYGELWQNDFKEIDGKMYGGIGVWNKELEQWIWRWDCGTESNTEAEKGQASDCFKRAGFKFLIGQELYKAPFIFIQCETVKKDNGKYELANKYAKFTVDKIGYSDNGEINNLVILDDSKDVVFNLTKKSGYKKKQEPKAHNDADIIAGLKAVDCKENAYNYFKTYEKEVANIEKFKTEYVKIYKSLPNQEELQGGN